MPSFDRITPYLKYAYDRGASDIHLIAGVPPAFRIDGEIILASSSPLTPDQCTLLVKELLTDAQREVLERNLELCFSLEVTDLGRFRVTVYFQGGHPELAIRRGTYDIPTREQLGLPKVVEDLTRRRSGLVLVTGPTGMGKTTTMNYMVDLVNRERRCKIVSIEDPIEYVHRPKKAIIVQQEVNSDVRSFSRALVHVLRQDPDVICVGEMRDLETISTALTAAETGHLVFATLHTPNALQTIERIISVFPASDQNQIVAQLANSIEGVIAQLLLPRANKKGRVLATEILVATPAVRNYIRTGESHKLGSVLQTGRKWGMQTMDMCLDDLYERAEITHDLLLAHKTQRDTDRPVEGLQSTGLNRG